MIVGIGTDIAEIIRVEEVLGRLGDAFAKRILDDYEMTCFLQSNRSVSYLAKRFAIKEAAAKALGTGIGRGISWHHIHTRNNEVGAPELWFTDGALERFNGLGGRSCHVSVSDEKHYATAFVVLEGDY